jgi:hypothetical protein
VIQQSTMDMFPNQMQMYNCGEKIDDDSIPLHALYIKQGMDAHLCNAQRVRSGTHM